MEFRTIVDIPKPGFEIQPCEEILFVGSCFADAIGRRFEHEGFPVTINPFGTMYNPVSIVHTLERMERKAWATVFLTLGTNHVYRLKETGEIVDNCEKRSATLFQEEELTVEECAHHLRQAITLLRQANPDVRVVLTVSPIRYRKYGYHGSQLSKATLLLAVQEILDDLDNPRQSRQSRKSRNSRNSRISYFPSYEIMNDELRDYRFYAADMIHPSEQAVDYLWERLVAIYFSPAAQQFLEEWRPLKQVLDHRPFHPESVEYQALMDKTMLKIAALRKKYTTFAK